MKLANSHQTCVGPVRVLYAAGAVLAVLGVVWVAGCTVGLPGFPTANAGPDQNTTSGTPVTLDGSGSVGNALSYQWSYVAGPPASQVSWITSANQATIQVSCNGDGDYQFRLLVTDGAAGSDADTLWLHVGSGFHVQIIPPAPVPVDPQQGGRGPGLPGPGAPGPL